MIGKLAKALALKESKKSHENSMASPTPLLVHMSTYPMKLAKKALEKKSKEADSASSNPAVLRGQTKDECK